MLEELKRAAHWKAIHFYLDMLYTLAPGAIDVPFIDAVCMEDMDNFSFSAPVDQLQHCAWMMEELISRGKTEILEVDKMARWIGFVQAALIIHGVTTINKERDRTRPWFTEGKL